MHLWYICLAPFIRTQIESLVHTMKIWWRAFEFSVWKWLKVITWPISIQFKITSNQSEFKVKMHDNFKLPVNANDQSQSYHSSAKSTPALAYPLPSPINMSCYLLYVAFYKTVDISGKHHPVEENHVQWIHVPRLGTSCGMAAGFIVFSGHPYLCSLCNFPSKGII